MPFRNVFSNLSARAPTSPGKALALPMILVNLCMELSTHLRECSFPGDDALAQRFGLAPAAIQKKARTTRTTRPRAREGKGGRDGGESRNQDRGGRGGVLRVPPPLRGARSAL